MPISSPYFIPEPPVPVSLCLNHPILINLIILAIVTWLSTRTNGAIAALSTHRGLRGCVIVTPEITANNFEIKHGLLNHNPEGTSLLLEAILNMNTTPRLLNARTIIMPGVRKELKLCEAKTVESSVDEPPEVELKELHHHLYKPH
ncbi:hypothetical protein Tco_0321649 [Tanacetum coccineum]